jgi:hypothetical protein
MADKRVSAISCQLDKEFGILCWVGMHSTPAAHCSIGSFPEGTVRQTTGPLIVNMDNEVTIQTVV